MDRLHEIDPALADDWRWKLAENVAASSALARADQLREMLFYLVRQAILRPQESIHEADIAHHALGRGGEFNPVDDNVVRVRMVHLRKKLEFYFLTEGKDEEAVITIPRGRYMPMFSRRDKQHHSVKMASSAKIFTLGPPPVPSQETSCSDEEDQIERSREAKSSIGRQRRPSVVWIIAALICGAIAGGAAAAWMQNRQVQRSLLPLKDSPAVSALWSSFLESRRNTDVVVGDDAYLLIQQITNKHISFDDYQSDRYLYVPLGKNSLHDLRFVLQLIGSKHLGNTDQFMTAQRILALAPSGGNLHLYSARQYSLALVQQDNVIIIGGPMANPWEHLFDDDLNFISRINFEGLGLTSIINRAQAAGEQKSYTWNGGVGYCAVAYLPKPDGTGKVLILQGTNSEADEAGGEFLLSESKMQGLLRALHATRFPYFEVLLRVSQVHGAPLDESIEAYRVYSPRQSTTDGK